MTIVFSHGLWHEDAFHAVRLNGRCRIRKRSIAAGDWRRRLLRSAGAHRQATWRTRQAAKLVAQAAELEVLRGRLAAASGDAGGAETAAGVVEALAGNARLTKLEHRRTGSDA